MPFPSSIPFHKKSNWLIAIAVEAAAPLLRAIARARTGAPFDYDPSTWRKALIVGDNHIGDLLYRSASLAPLKAALPECEFHYLAAPGSSAVLEGNPALTGILPWLKSDSPLDLSQEHFEALRAMQFDAVLSTNCIKYWPELLLAVRLGVPNRAGYTYKGFSGWVTHPIPIQYPRPFAAYFRDYVAALTSRKASWKPRPVIMTNPADETEADALWAARSLNRHPRVLASFITSRQPTGIWPAAKFGETLRLVRERTGAHILLCGAASDEPLLAAIDREHRLEATIIAGSLGLRALSCFLKRCSAVLTADSGPRHIANAAGVPVIFVRNVWFNPVEAGPYVETETDLCPLPSANAPDGAALLASISPATAAEIVSAILSR